ncbi:hypothetical protein Pan181_40750 [Aeoliella mucimassa]|uniref:Outer membrane protein beta-barrel domain-containing protein n=2 Tax=Aeoliella mucimassa TaxID=2527972 RepID=A0A518AT14_9BACT|nr:hypothetical protein Pan181_40750 [Aeoliella mucimassa]
MLEPVSGDYPPGAAGDVAPSDWCADEWGGPMVEPASSGSRWSDWRERMRFRHSMMDGRAIGKGQPLRTTSWLNRPYEFGIDTGAFLMANDVSSNNTSNNDLMVAAHLGWDWDHYWGAQARMTWTTPEFASSVDSNDQNTNTLMMYDVSLMYYPWGDSRVRPYYRLGMGLTDLDFINPSGVREDNTLFTIPMGLGIKYQTERWMAIRAEAMDNIAWGQNSASSMHNFTLTIGFEWRYGGRPSSGWSSPAAQRTW